MKVEKVTCQGGLHQTLTAVMNWGRVSRNSRQDRFLGGESNQIVYIILNVFDHVFKNH